MTGVNRTDHAGTTQQEPSPRLDGPVLVSNLVSGALLLVVLAFLAWPLAVVGAAYVAAASVFLAAVYTRKALTRRQEATAWAAPWLAAVALWTWVGAGIEGGASSSFLTLWFGLVFATPSYLGWQALALAARQLLAWRARPAAA
jgi:hypothetical protein